MAASPWLTELDLMTEAVTAAGEEALRHFERGVRHWVKDGNSPVSEADMAVDRMLAEQLGRARPDYGWLSEESENDPERLQRERVFIVDPIDGTRGFIKGSDQWTICAALSEGGQVRAGVVHNPVRRETFQAITGGGAYCNGEAINVSPRHDIAGARMAAAKGAVAPLGAMATNVNRSYVHSLAYRFALVARGDFDATMSAGHAHEWDIAAAALIVEEAGGAVTHRNGKPPRFNKPHPTVAPLIAAGPDLHAQLQRRLKRARAH